MVKRESQSDPYFDRSVGLWRASVELPPGRDGKRRRKKVSGTSEVEVRRRVQELRKQIELGLVVNMQLRSVRQFLECWHADVLPGTVSDGTVETYERVLRLWVMPHVGHVKLKELRPADVTAMMRAMEGDGLSVAARSLARRTLARALRRAEQEGWVLRNAARLADGPRGGRDAEQRVLTADEARKFLDAIKGDRLERPITAQLALGLRRGEVLGITWKSLKLEGERPIVHIRRQIQRRKGGGLVLDNLKTRKCERLLALPQPLVALFEDEQERQKLDKAIVGDAWDGGLELAFATLIGTPIDPDNHRHQVSDLAKKAGIGHIGTHTLRHSSGPFLQRQAHHDAAKAIERTLW